MKPASHIFVVMIALITLAGHASKAEAVTTTVAKACSRALAKVFPPREPGNPAAGSAAGSAEDQRQFYTKCVAKGGHVDDPSTKVGK